MRYHVIGSDPRTRREVSVLSLGAMLMGSATDEATSLMTLDRYVEAGGTFIDTANNYAFWVDGSQGGHSEELLGRLDFGATRPWSPWVPTSPPAPDAFVHATKLGGPITCSGHV